MAGEFSFTHTDDCPRKLGHSRLLKRRAVDGCGCSSKQCEETAYRDKRYRNAFGMLLHVTWLVCDGASAPFVVLLEEHRLRVRVRVAGFVHDAATDPPPRRVVLLRHHLELLVLAHELIGEDVLVVVLLVGRALPSEPAIVDRDGALTLRSTFAGVSDRDSSGLLGRAGGIGQRGENGREILVFHDPVAELHDGDPPQVVAEVEGARQRVQQPHDVIVIGEVVLCGADE